MLATRLGIPIISSDIIYRVMEDVRSSLVALLPLIIETKVLGEADVLQVFDIELKGGKTMKVAGCRVINGLVQKHKSARVVRAGEVIHQGKFQPVLSPRGRYLLNFLRALGYISPT